MQHRNRRLVALLAVAGALVATAPPARAVASVIGSWAFTGSGLGSVPPGSSFGEPALYAAGDRTSLHIVQASRGRVLDALSWRGLRPGQSVPRSGTLLSTDPQAWVGKPWGSDGGSSTFDPGREDFSVSVWLRPTDAAAFPRGSKPVGSVSPNIVQKGRADVAGGYWKVGLQMVRTAEGLAWAPECVLKGGDGTTIVANRSGEVLTLTPGAGATVTCERTGDSLAISVAEDGGPLRTSVVRGAGGLVVSNKAAVSVGQKPGSTAARDAYDGQLADVIIARG